MENYELINGVGFKESLQKGSQLVKLSFQFDCLQVKPLHLRNLQPIFNC